MKKYLNEFLKRGLIFGGFGPIVIGIVYWIISLSTKLVLTGGEVLVAIVSGYLLAFIQAGATVFNQIEDWSIAKSLFCHFGLLYLAYLTCYLVNTWIPFNWTVVLIFTIVFVVTFFIIWFVIYFVTKITTNKLNSKLK